MKKIIAMLIVGALVLSCGAVYAAGGAEKCAQCEKSDKARQGHFEKGGLYKDLNLTDAQKKMLDDNKNKNKEEMKALFSAIKDQRTAMRQELQKPNLDMGKLTQINNELKKLDAQMIDNRLNGVLEVRKILSPEQFKKFMEKMGERREHFKGKKD